MIRCTLQYLAEGREDEVRSVFVSGLIFEIILGTTLTVISFIVSGFLSNSIFNRVRALGAVKLFCRPLGSSRKHLSHRRFQHCRSPSRQHSPNNTTSHILCSSRQTNCFEFWSKHLLVEHSISSNWCLCICFSFISILRAPSRSDSNSGKLSSARFVVCVVASVHLEVGLIIGKAFREPQIDIYYRFFEICFLGSLQNSFSNNFRQVTLFESLLYYP